MPSLNSSLNIGARSLFNQQSGIATAGHNIANLNTEGFSRQEVHAKSELAQPDGTGGGVRRGMPQRIFDRFTSRKIVQEESNSAALGAREKFLAKLEIIFNESDDAGLRRSLNEFWDSWSLLANEPESDAAREKLKNQSEALSSRFRSMHMELRGIRSEANSRVAGVVSEINNIVDQIADLNRQISSYELVDRTANDARDRRQLLLEKLSQKVDVSWLEDSRGQMKVSVGSTGWSLVEGRKGRELRASLVGGETGMYHIQGIGEHEYKVDLSNEFRSGELKEVLDIRDKTIVSYMQQLDDLAFGLAHKLNKIHASGTGLSSGMERIKSSYGLNQDAQLEPLPFIKDGIFQFHLLDDDEEFYATYEIEIQAGKDNIYDIVNRINETVNDPLYFQASIEEDGSAVFLSGGGKQFIFGDDQTDFNVVMGFNNFFETLNGAEDIRVNNRLLEDPKNISSGKDLVPGDNQIALEIAKLQTRPTMNDETQTFDEFYNGILADVGLRIQRNQVEKEHQDTMLAQFKDIRDSVSSVNMDEEVANLVQYQKAYEASAKFVSTVDGMMETVIQM
ncbi:MAG: flagellar hook-associated protein FlgK [SAR324 cluster bacterium]|nr:flagellar hook-associated protein FlgK [SAR324 cluster bacterium]